RNTETEDVHQGISGVSIVERDFTADGWNTDAVAVAGNAGDDAFDDSSSAGAVGPVHLAEPERVHKCDWSRAHGENVTDDAADTRRCTLIWLDERWMVVRFDLEDRCQSITDVDSPCILAGSLQHPRPFRRKLLQVPTRALVAAVLRPHDRKDPEFGQRRFASKGLDDAIVLISRETVTFEEGGVDGAHEVTVRAPPCTATCDSTDSSNTRPSPLPRT